METGQPAITNRLKSDVASLSLDKDGLRKFCNILQQRADSAAEIEVNLFQQGDQSDEQYQENKETLRESFKLKVTICGKDGEELFGHLEEVFDSVNFPDEVQSLYIDSKLTLQTVHKFYPHNGFKVFLDFSKPKVLDFRLLPSVGTPNESNLEVQGQDATWVNGVYSELNKFIENRSSKTSVVHNHSVYDVLLWVLGFPVSFWFCYNLSAHIEKLSVNWNSFATSALYLYTFVASLFFFRVLFHYLRWVCPLVEYRSQSNKVLVHRTLLGVLCIGWFGQFLFEIGKWLLIA